jgi:ribosomal protein L37E
MGRKLKYEIPICRNCGIEVYEEKRDRNICKECAYTIQKFKQVVNKSSLVSSNENNLMREHLLEFIPRILDRNGMASFEEIFLEMITLSNHFCLQKHYINVPPDKQISNMWRELKIVYQHIKDYKSFIYYGELFGRRKIKNKIQHEEEL